MYVCVEWSNQYVCLCRMEQPVCMFIHIYMYICIYINLVQMYVFYVYIHIYVYVHWFCIPCTGIVTITQSN